MSATSSMQGQIGGIALIERTLLELSQEEDCRKSNPAEWDPSLVELSAAVQTRIPALVEQRCRAARYRTNCGLIGEVRHAWASADDTLHIWDYSLESPEVLVVPADSAIVSVAVCPPRPGIFDNGSVRLIIVLCTRLTVSLLGICTGGDQPLAPTAATPSLGAPWSLLAASGARPAAHQQPPVGSVVAPDTPAALFGQQRPLETWPGSSPAGSRTLPGRLSGLRLVPLEGYTTPTCGAIFHCITHTADGHILLSAGSPQIYELVYSKTPGLFHSKCRLIQHSLGIWARLRDLVRISPQNANRIRLLACAPRDYVIAVDDVSTMRLFGLRDQAVQRSESVAMLEELASISITEVSAQHVAMFKTDLVSRIIVHVFPTIGLDGHVRVRAVTSSGQRLLFVCSSASPTGPAAASAAAPQQQQPQQQPQLRHHGFWLRQADEARPGGNPGALTYQPSQGVFSIVPAGQQGALQAGRSACLEEQREPCLYAGGVWLAALQRPGASSAEVGVTARVDDPASGGKRSLFTALSLDSPIFDLVEEGDLAVGLAGAAHGGTGSLPAPLPIGANQDGMNRLDGNRSITDGESTAFRTTRSFALLLRGAVQVFRLSFKAQSLHRPPTTAAECCAQLGQLALPSAATSGQSSVPRAVSGHVWAWSFDDAGVPSFEEQRRMLEISHTVPDIHLGRWFSGLLRFLSLVLRPVLNLPLVVSLKGRQFADVSRSQGGEGFCLAIGEDTVRGLLARLRPAVRFARQQGLAALPGQESPGRVAVPASAAARARHFSERTTEHEGLAQVQHLLASVLDVADRAQQVLGLLNVLHAQKTAYRILQSEIVAGKTLDSLMTTPFGDLVATAEALEPVVKLCAAMVVESGLTTPAAELIFEGKGSPVGDSLGIRNRASTKSPVHGFAGSEVCRDLEEQCSGILSRVDLAYVQGRLGAAGRQGAGAAGELLRRYATCVGTGALNEHWVELIRSLQTMAVEDPMAAADICAEKLEQLQQVRFSTSPTEAEVAQSADRAKLLLEALLGALGADPRVQAQAGGLGGPCAEVSTRALVERLLKKTGALRFPGKDSTGPPGHAKESAAAVLYVHGLILDHLLGSSAQHAVLEALLENSSADVEAFLRSRCSAHRAAGDLLWKHYHKQGRPLDAAQILHQLAERADKECGLQQRVHFLDCARQAAGRQPHCKEAVEATRTLTAKLNVAVRVQAPLFKELQLISTDERVSNRWRSLADQRREELHKLMGLQDLYQIASDFSLFHIVLVIADLSSSTQERETGSYAWISVFFPPADSPYHPSQLGAELATFQHGIFPLLMVRRCEDFFAQEIHGAPSAVTAAAGRDDFQLRATRFLREIASAMSEASSMWDVRVVGIVLEYGNCLWNHAVPVAALAAPQAQSAASEASDEARAAPMSDSGIAWVALNVLQQAPFNFSTADVVKFYMAQLDHLPSWFRDLQGHLPTDPTRRRPVITEDDMFMHLGEVILVVLDRWVAQVDGSRADERAVEEMAGGWPSAEAVLATLRTRLGETEGEPQRNTAQRLLKEVRRIEAFGRRISARCASQPAAQLAPLAPQGLPLGAAKPLLTRLA